MKRFGINSNEVMTRLGARIPGQLGSDYVGLDVFRAHTLATVDQEVDILAALETIVLHSYGARVLRRLRAATGARIARKRVPTPKQFYRRQHLSA